MTHMLRNRDVWHRNYGLKCAATLPSEEPWPQEFQYTPKTMRSQGQTGRGLACRVLPHCSHVNLLVIDMMETADVRAVGGQGSCMHLTQGVLLNHSVKRFTHS